MFGPPPTCGNCEYCHHWDFRITDGILYHYNGFACDITGEPVEEKETGCKDFNYSKEAIE